MHLITKQATLVDFYSYSDCRIADLPGLAYDLKKRGKDILQIVARRKDGGQ